jgi:hypothetical protein
LLLIEIMMSDQINSLNQAEGQETGAPALGRELSRWGIWGRLPWWWKITSIGVLSYVAAVVVLAWVDLTAAATFKWSNQWLAWITRPGVIIGAPWLCWLCTYYEAGNPFVRPKLKPATCAIWLRRIVWAPPVLLLFLCLADAAVIVLWVTRVNIPVGPATIIIRIGAYVLATGLAVGVSWKLWPVVLKRYQRSILRMSMCFRCGYDLRGNPSAEICSECGQDLKLLEDQS